MSDNERCGHGACVRPKGHTGSHSVALKGTPFSVPQDEDHEARSVIKAMAEIVRRGYHDVDSTGRFHVEAECRTCAALAASDAYLSRVSPSRVGSVAVEDVVRRLRFSDALAPDAGVREVADWIEREFSRSSTDRPEQPEPDVLGGQPPAEPK